MVQVQYRVIGVVLALSVAVAGAGRAHAENYQTERTIAALLGFAVVGALIANNKKRDKKADEAARRAEEARRIEEAKRIAEARRYEEAKRYEQAKRLEEVRRAQEATRAREERLAKLHAQYAQQVAKPRPVTVTSGLSPRPLPETVRRELLPQDCLRHIETGRGSRQIYGNRCLQSNYKYVASLPQHCVRQFQGRHGNWRQGWSAECLHHQGYRAAYY